MSESLLVKYHKIGDVYSRGPLMKIGPTFNALSNYLRTWFPSNYSYTLKMFLRTLQEGS